MAQMPPGGTFQPDLNAPAEPPGWPKGLGIFSIVWGSLGVICNGCGAIGIFFGASLHELGRNAAKQGNQPDPGPFPDVMRVTSLEIVGWVISFIGVFILLAAGIALVRRATSARATHLVYAIVSIMGTLVWCVGGVLKSSAIAAHIVAHPDDPFFKNPMAQMGTNPTFGLVISFIALIYPVFILIWFLAVKKRPEDMGRIAEDPLA